MSAPPATADSSAPSPSAGSHPSDPSNFLLQHFDRLAEAPGGIAKLRALILQLGVQGKLTQQSPEDTPATENISHFRKLKQPFTPISADELPFQIPATWVWARLGACMELFNGRAFKPADWSTQGLPIIRIKNLNNESAPFNHCATAVDARHLVKNDDFLISWSGTPGTSFGAFIWKRGKAVLNQHIFRAELSSPELYKPYTRLAVNSRLDELIEKAHGGVGLQHVTKPTLERLPLPLPPLAEQRRIVAKVEELMGLCDALEAAQQEREAMRTRLRTSALHQLASPDSDSNPAAFVLKNLPGLTTEPEDLADIRQSVLQLAVQGRLVAQSPEEGIGLRLLKEIDAAKKIALQEKRVRRLEEFSELEPEELLHEAPKSWTWSRLGAAFDVRDGTHATPKYYDRGVPLVTSKNLYSGTLDLAGCKLISEEDHASISERSGVDRDDILFAMIGTIGNPVIVDLTPHFSIKNVALFKYYDRSLSDPRYLLLYLKHVAAIMRTRAAGGLQPFVSLGFLRAFPIPLPPLAEQRRIVAKVDEIMAVLAALAATLTAARATAEKLLAATVAKLAVSPSNPLHAA